MLRQAALRVVDRLLPQRELGSDDREWPPVLDARRSLPLSTWNRWMAARLRDVAAPAAAGENLIFLIHGDGEALVSTLAAIADVAPGATALAGGDAAERERLRLARPDALWVFLNAGDRPSPALAARLAAIGPEAQVVTFDLFRTSGDRVEPLALPGANPVLLGAHDYLFSRAAVRASALTADPRGVREAILVWCAGRSVEAIRAGWRHIGLPLLSAAIPGAELQAMHEGALERAHRPLTPTRSAPASVIICTRDKGHLLRQLGRSLLALGPLEIAEIVIVANGAANPYALQTLEDLAQDSRVRVLVRDEPFNFSRLTNAGVAETRGGGPLLLLNDDIAPVSDGWLAALKARLDTPGTGAVGPLLLYPREQVQHAGMYLRRLGGAGHLLRGAALPDDDYLALASSEREVSCLTGAALLTDRGLFERLGGLDEAFAISLQDVDYGLKLYRAGLRNVFEPRAVLLHMESTSISGILRDPRVEDARRREWALFMDRWGDLAAADPFCPAGFEPEDESLRRLAPP